MTDAYGHAVPGAMVRVVGTTAGTRADGDGEWALDLPAGAHALEISRAGLRPQRWTVQVRAGGTARLDAVLDAGSVSDEVQIDSAEEPGAEDGWGDEDADHGDAGYEDED